MFTREDVLRAAEYWLKILDIDKQIDIRFSSQKPIYSVAQVYKVKDGRIIDDGKILIHDDFDGILITIWDLGLKMPRSSEIESANSMILHELLHVKHPKWSEMQVRDETEQLLHEWVTDRLLDFDEL
jgi:hypothetical protein